MSKGVILAIDQGTTGTTCLLVDRELNLVARANRPFPQHFPKPGLVEHDPDEIWESVCGAIGDVVEASALPVSSIVAVGIANQRETSLIWDRKDGTPVHRAIVWQDRRTLDTCETLKSAGEEAEVRKLTGLLLDPYFSATKLAWVLDNVEGARTRAEQGKLLAGTIDTYLAWRLTGGATHLTEPSNASRTLLWPLDGSGWSEDLCRLFGVPLSMLPEVCECAADFGETFNVPGLPDGIPVTGMMGDQQAALFAQACFESGEAKCTYGTGAFVMLNTGERPVMSEHGLLTTVGWKLGGRTVYCLEGSAFMAGAVVQWLRDGLGIIETAAEVEALAESVPDSAGVVMVPGHAGLGAPHWRPEARGLVTGITRGTTKAHIARAALEGIALQVFDLLEAMEADFGAKLTTLRVDGGAAANNLLMQIQANILGVSLERSRTLETTALGAVFMAGLGVGLWSSTEALLETLKPERTFQPISNDTASLSLKKNWKKAVPKAW